MSKSIKTSALLSAVCAATVMTAPAFAAGNLVTNGDFEYAAQGTKTATQGVLIEGQDVNLNTANDGWQNWAQSSNTMARTWNPSTTDRWTSANNEFYDTSWGGNDASGDADGQVLVVRTMGWDYRPSSGIGATTDLNTVWHDDWNNRIWTVNDNGTSAASTGGNLYEWRYIDGGTPDDLQASPYTYANEGSVGSWSGTAVRDFEGVAQNVGAFDASAKYVLTVKVGRLAEAGYNAGATILPGSDLTYGTGDDSAGNSSRFFNDAPSLWGGYMVDIMAGGDHSDPSSYNAWIYGQSTDPNAPGYIQTIASDDNTVAVAEDGWATTTLQYIPGVSGDMSALDGMDLIIRLSAKEIAGQHQNTTSAAFDDVVLLKIVAGDTDEDGDIDDSDLGNAFANYTGPVGAAGGKTWNDGDFDGDGDVDDSDLGTAFSAYTGPLSLAAVPEPTSLALIGLGGLALIRRRRA